MGSPAVNLNDWEEDADESPADIDEGTSILDVGDLLDAAPAANDNADGGEPAATPEQVRAAQRQYEAEHPGEVPQLRTMGFESPDGAVKAETVDLEMPVMPVPREAPANSNAGKSLREQGYAGVVDTTKPDPLFELAKQGGLAAVDTARGIGQGVTSGWGDEIAAAITPESDSPLMKLAAFFGGEGQDTTGIPRNYAAGSAYADARNSNRRDNAESQARSPWLYGSGELIGAGAQMAATGALGTELAALGNLGKGTAAIEAAQAAQRAQQLANAGKVIPLATSVGRGMAQGAAQGAAYGAGTSLAEDPADVATDAGVTAAIGAPIGAAVPLLVSGLGHAARRGVPSLQQLSHWLRGKAVGAPDELGIAADAIGRTPGESAATAVGRKVEELGLPGVSKLPMKGSDYASAAAARADDSGQQLGIVLDRNSAAGVAVPKDDVVNDLLTLARQYRGDITDNGRSQTALVGRALNRLQASDADALTARDLQTLKNQFEKQGGFRKGEAPPTPRISAAKEAAREVASIMRRNLGRAMDDMALREDLPAFHDLNREIGAARSIQSYASGAEGQSGITRPLQRALGAHGGDGPMSELWHAGKDYAADATASVAKELAELAKHAGKLATPAATEWIDAANGAANTAALRYLAADGAPTKPAPITPQLSIGAVAEQRPQERPPATAAERSQSSSEQLPSVAGSPDAVRMMLRDIPQAFGPYTQQLRDAAARKDPEALAAELFKLQQNADFRRQYMAQDQ
jgi:hypothetical protein